MPEITYLMATDPAGATNGYFANAKGYFLGRRSTVVDAPAGGQTLEGVFDDLRARAAAGAAGTFDQINLVSHATGFSSLMFGLTKSERGGILTAARLTNALATASSSAPILKKLGPPAVTDKTHVRLYGCDVGKDRPFLRDVGLMFGMPADVTAPLRVAVFRHDGATFAHRLARTWAVPWPSDVERTPPQGWAPVRQAFVAKAESKFGSAAAERSPGDLFAADAVKATLTAAAAAATATTASTFFFHEYVEVLIPTTEADPQAFVNTVRPATSGVVTASEVSDLTVASRVGPADFTDRSNPRSWVAHVAVLAQVIEAEVSVRNDHLTVAIAPASAPTPGPAPVGDGGSPPPPVPPPAHSLWQQATDEFLAAGGAQGDLDALIAGLDAPPPDHDLAEPDLPALDDGGEPADLLAPEAVA